MFSDASPLDLRIMSRMVFHAALVGAAAGLAGAAFFAALEYVQYFLLEVLAGYRPLRAAGETLVEGAHGVAFRPWLLVVLPAVGGLVCGLLTRFAPSARGGGGDATIEAFHERGGSIPRRVLWVKPLASLASLGTGGVGGREGPTMQIGGALGSRIGRLLNVTARERRILLVAGVAAGISAVFRTPLGAALLAVEVLYRDGFESEALIPSVLASVVAYSVVISIFGETTLFTHAPRFPFTPGHLPLFGLLAVVMAAAAALFASTLRRMRGLFARLPISPILRPALGGLLVGAMCTPIIVAMGSRFGEGQGLGLLGGGYGAVQMAISGSGSLPEGWSAVQILAVLAAAKLVAASLTIGSGGSAGDFAPSLAIGGLLGGAFGRVAQLLVDSSIDPGAFALVGMGVFYGGIAHVPLAGVILVCELAGNYDLLVPLMLAQGIAFAALRKRGIYDAQVATPRDSPVHRDAWFLDLLKAVRVRDLGIEKRPPVLFELRTPLPDMLDRLADATWQDVFPVVDEQRKMVGLVSAASIQSLARDGTGATAIVAADVMQPPAAVHLDDDLRAVTERLLAHGLREIPVLDKDGQILGFLDEDELVKVHVTAAARADAAGRSTTEIPTTAD